MQQLITNLKALLATNPKDRYIKGHAKDLLTRLQALTPQDDEVIGQCECGQYYTNAPHTCGLS